MTDREKDFFPEDEGAGGTPSAGPEGESPERAPARDEAREELERLKSRLAYLAAEFDNYRKRVVREKEALVSFGNERLLAAILPFLDNLERALSHGVGAEADEALLSGVRMTYDQILAELRRFGLTQIAAAGQPFDPNLHEAVATVPWEGTPEGTVLSECRKGYLLNGRLLRPAQVTVAAAPAGSPGGGNSGEGDAAGRRED